MSKWKAIRPLLAYPYHRERFRGTCLVGRDDVGKLFEHFNGDLYEHRWMAVHTFVSKAAMLLYFTLHDYM